MSKNSKDLSANERTIRYNPQKSIDRARAMTENIIWQINVNDQEYCWRSNMDRVKLIREGIPYESLEHIGTRSGLPISQILLFFGIPQTTYNKKKRENGIMDRRDSEIVLILAELLQFGLEVFNDETKKFHRWLNKQNISLGGISPKSLFDSLTGIQEVRNALNRLEFGNMA